MSFSKKHQPIKTSLNGFTLIEIMIALMVFAILATITASSLYNTATTQSRVTNQLDQLNTIQLTINHLLQDIQQITLRPVRGNELRLFPPFIGQEKYLEFTRDGVSNPNFLEQRSTLQRVALVCSNNQFIRRTWPTLDPINRAAYHDTILLDNIKNCHFKYLNQTGELLLEWRDQSLMLNQQKDPLPKAIQVNLTLTSFGEMNLLLIVPGAFYEEVQHSYSA